MAEQRDRPSALLDAAVEVIGAAGLRGLTHRATDGRAGLPAGTCSYHFPTRSALVGGILTQIVTQERADIERLGEGRLTAGVTPEALLDATTAIVAHWLGSARTRTRAGLLLRLDPASQEHLAAEIAELGGGFRELALRFVPDGAAAELAIALIEGVLVAELTSGQVPPADDQLRSRLGAIVAIVLPEHR